MSKSAVGDPAALNESVLQILECPVCYLQMEPPIEMCKNGHNLCNPCKTELTECPLCKAEFASVRNRALEDIADNMLYPCSNQQFGCEVSCTRAEMSDHCQVCNYKPLECLPFKMSGCTWKGGPSDLYEHEKTHEQCLIYENMPMKLHFFPSLAMNVVRLAKVGDAVFWVHIRQDPEMSKYFRAVQYIGDPKKASQYRFSIQMFVGDKMNTAISFERNVYTLKDDIEDLYETDELLATQLGFIRDIRDSKNIVYKFNIEKETDVQ